jgi:hypothetical protein
MAASEDDFPVALKGNARARLTIPRCVAAPVGSRDRWLAAAAAARRDCAPGIVRMPEGELQMLERFVMIAALAVPLLVAPPALAKDALAKDAPAKDSSAKAPTAQEAPASPAAKQPSAGQAAARERQKTCGAEWRALTDAQKTAQGPKWPQYWSKCNKRLKGGDKA